MNAVCLILAVVVSAAGVAHAQAPLKLQQYKCYYCHADNEAKAGPAFVDVAARYRGKPQAVAVLVATVRKGSLATDRGTCRHIPKFRCEVRTRRNRCINAFLYQSMEVMPRIVDLKRRSSWQPVSR